MTADESIREELVALLPRLRRFALGLTGSRDQADDLVQNACERALKNLHQYQADTRFDSWMFRITKNIWIDTWRARKAQGLNVELETAEYEARGYCKEDVENRHTLAAVSRAMQKLPEDQRVVLTLVSVEGLSYKEAAKVLEVPAGTVMSRLSRARRRLYELIA